MFQSFYFTLQYNNCKFLLEGIKAVLSNSHMLLLTIWNWDIQLSVPEVKKYEKMQNLLLINFLSFDSLLK